MGRAAAAAVIGMGVGLSVVAMGVVLMAVPVRPVRVAAVVIVTAVTVIVMAVIVMAVIVMAVVVMAVVVVRMSRMTVVVMAMSRMAVVVVAMSRMAMIVVPMSRMAMIVVAMSRVTMIVVAVGRMAVVVVPAVAVIVMGRRRVGVMAMVGPRGVAVIGGRFRRRRRGRGEQVLTVVPVRRAAIAVPALVPRQDEEVDEQPEPTDHRDDREQDQEPGSAAVMAALDGGGEQRPDGEDGDHPRRDHKDGRAQLARRPVAGRQPVAFDIFVADDQGHIDQRDRQQSLDVPRAAQPPIESEQRAKHVRSALPRAVAAKLH